MFRVPGSTHLVVGTTREGGTVYYTGGAGDRWASPDPDRAIVAWYQSGAERIAERFNRYTALHGITWRAEAA